MLDCAPLLGIEGFEVGGCRLQLRRPFIVRSQQWSVIPAVIATVLSFMVASGCQTYADFSGSHRGWFADNTA